MSATKVIGIAAFTAAMLAGGFKIPYLGQARFVFTLVCLGCVAVVRKNAPINLSSFRLALVLTALCTFLAVHATLFGAADYRVRYILDLSHLAILGWLAVALFRTTADAEVLAGCLVVAGAVMLPAWLTSSSPAFGPITLYRAEFIAFAASLYLALRGRVWALALLPVFLFGTMASLSKAAVVCGTVAVAYAIFILAVLRQPVAKFGAAALIGCALFGALSMSTFSSRLAVMEQPREFPRQMSNEVTINDGSQRIRMALQAIALARQDMVWGTGIGAYRIELMNSDEAGYDLYRYPHNVTLEVFYSTGLVGSALYVATVFIFMVTLHRRVIASPPVAAIGAAVVFVFLTSHFSGDFYDLRFFWLLLLPRWASDGPRSTLVDVQGNSLGGARSVLGNPNCHEHGTISSSQIGCASSEAGASVPTLRLGSP